MRIEEYIPQPVPETKLWRYMDFAKFMSMLHTSALFFCQVKQLEDSYEGSIQGWLDHIQPGSEEEKEAILFYNAPNGMRAYSAVSSWHMNNQESAAMWKLYLTNNQGIALQTTVEKLGESLKVKWKEVKVIKSAVTYEKIPKPPAGAKEGQTSEIALFWKRPSFAYENEYRIALIGATSKLRRQLDLGGGLTVTVDLDKLIEHVYIAPTAPLWIKPLVESILKTEYKLNKPVHQSDLDSRALW